MFIKVIELAPATASTLGNRLRKAAVSGDIVQFTDIHGNNYVVCHGTETGKVVYGNYPTNIGHVLEVAYKGAGLLRGQPRYRKYFNIICCHAAMFKDTYETGVDYRSNPETGTVYPGSSVKAKHVFADCSVPVGWLTMTTVIGNYLVVQTIPPDPNRDWF